MDLVYDLVYFLGVMQVNVHYAKTHFSELLRRVATGEAVVIARSGNPVARLVPAESVSRPRVLGEDAGQGTVMDAFLEPLGGEVLQDFEAGSLDPNDSGSRP